MSVADPHTTVLVCEREAAVLKKKMDVQLPVQNNSPQKSNDTCIHNSPRPINSAVYTPLPFTKRDMPTSEPEHKAEPKADVAVPVCENIVGIDTESVEHASIKALTIYSPVPYIRYRTSYSPVNWQKTVVTCVPDKKPGVISIPEEKQPNDQNADDISARNSPVAHVKENDDHDKAALALANKATSTNRTPRKKDDYNDIERVDTDLQKENRWKEELIKKKPSEKQQGAIKQDKVPEHSRKKTTKVARQNKLKTTATVSEPEATADTDELHGLKQVDEAHSKEKENSENIIEKREDESKEQMREMDEVMRSVYSEHIDIKMDTRAFANAVKAHSDCMEKMSRVVIQHIKQEVSSDILFNENSELIEEIHELYDIKERRAVESHGLKEEVIQEASGLLKIKNEDVEEEIKQNFEEFNSLRIIKNAKKGEIIQRAKSIASFPIASIPKSPQVKIPNTIRSELEIDIRNMGNVVKGRNDNTTESGRLSKSKSEQTSVIYGHDTVENNTCGEDLITEKNGKKDYSFLDDERAVQNPLCARNTDERNGEGDVPLCLIASNERCKSEVPEERQISTAALARLPGVDKKKSRIPKPLLQPCGRASKHSGRFKVTEDNSIIITQSENCKRDVFVPDDHIRETKPTMYYLDPEAALLEQKKCVVSKQIEEWKKFKTGNKLISCAVKKSEIAQICRKKKEIKPKIDTGLKSRPSSDMANKPEKIIDVVGKLDKSATRKDTKKEQEPMKYSNEGSRTKARKEQLRVKAMKPDLSVLQKVPNIAKNVTNVPKSSSSFGNDTPLPRIKSTNNQRKEMKKTSEKRALSHPTSPQLQRQNMNRLTRTFTNIRKDTRSPQISSMKQAPEPIWVLSSTPPNKAATSRIPKKLQSSRQDYKTRVSSERAYMLTGI